LPSPAAWRANEEASKVNSSRDEGIIGNLGKLVL